jgi:hypothetical protein
MMNIAQMRISALRSAIQTNQVSFPAQTPRFSQSRADIEWRLVQLYFVRGWNCIQLARRYNLTRQRIEQLLAGWVDCASKLGFLQEIPAPSLRIIPRTPFEYCALRSPSSCTAVPVR